MIFDKLFQRRTIPAASPGGGNSINFYRPATAGITVTENSALNYSAVFACVKIVSETMSTLPWGVHRHNGDIRETAKDHPAHKLLKRRPNPEMEPNVFKTLMSCHLLLWGVHYSEIEFNRMGEPVALWPLDPASVEPKRDGNNRLFYEVRQPNGKTTTLSAKKVFRVLGLTLDGVTPCSVINFARESIAMGMAAEAYGAAFFGNSALPGGYIKASPGKGLKEEGVKNLLSSWNKKLQGSKKAHKVQYLDDGMEFVPLSIPQKDAQFLESRKFQVLEVCRWFRMPPHKLAELERAQHNNIESQNIEFVTDTIMPWVVKCEEAANFKLIDDEDHFTKFNLNALLRGDTLTRSQFYEKMFDRGVFSIDEIRSREDMNPLPNGQGDLRLVPLNMVSVDTANQNGGTVQQPERNAEQLWRDPAERMVRKEAKALASMLKKGMTAEDLQNFYGKHQQHIIESFLPVATFESINQRAIKEASKWYCLDSRGELKRFGEGEGTQLSEFESIWQKQRVDVLINFMRTQNV